MEDFKGNDTNIYSQYSEEVIGQERAKKKLLQAIYPLVDGKQSKPVVILLYGDSGLGKTESAQYMAELMVENY